jgi:hypothetical protein
MKRCVENFLEGSDAHRILGLILLSLVIKAVILYNATLINPDGVRYVNSAHQLLLGNLEAAFGHESMLFYPLTLGLFPLIIPDWFWAGKILSAFFLTLTLVPLYHLSKELFGARAALWAGLAFILLPAANGMTAEIVKDAPFLFFILTALVLGIRALQTPRPLLFFLTFCSACLATLFRLEGVVFILAYLPAVALAFFRATGPRDRRGYVRGLALFLAIPVAVSVLAGGVILSGVFSPETIQRVWEPFRAHYFNLDFLKTYHQIYAYLKSIEGKFHGGEWGQDFFEIARHNMAWIYLWGMLLKFFKDLFPLFLIPLAVGFSCRDRYRTGLLLTLWMSFSYLAMNYYFILSRNFISGRYLMVVVLFFLPIIGGGLERIRIWVCSRYHPKTLGVVLTLIFVVYPAAQSLTSSREEKDEIRQCGLWLKQYMDLDKRKILTTEERVLFHAGLLRDQYQYFKDKGQGLERLESVALGTGCDLLIVRATQEDVSKVNLIAYHLLKEFPGAKVSIFVYGRGALAPRLVGEPSGAGSINHFHLLSA